MHIHLRASQQVEILRALMADARVVILDEPTSALAPQEVGALLDGIRTLVHRPEPDVQSDEDAARW